jgi:hypothetical protein
MSHRSLELDRSVSYVHPDSDFDALNALFKVVHIIFVMWLFAMAMAANASHAIH